MAKAAVRSHMDGFGSSTQAEEAPNKTEELLIISGKGLHSEKTPVLQSAVLSTLKTEYGVEATVDATNPGRVVVSKAELEKFVSRGTW